MKRLKTYENFSGEENPQKHQYMMLSRLQHDCDYFLGNGSGSEKPLYYKSVEEHIAEMKKLWNELKEKPEWLSMEDIENYEQRMLNYNENSMQEAVSFSDNSSFTVTKTIKVPSNVIDIIDKFVEENFSGEFNYNIHKQKIIDTVINSYISNLMGESTYGYFEDFNMWFNDGGYESIDDLKITEEE